MKKRLGDIASRTLSIEQKVNPTPEERKARNNDSSHVCFNNPLMQESPQRVKEDYHSHQRVPIFNRTPSGTHTGSHTASPTATNLPQWQREFPYINHDNIDIEMRKELWK